MLEFLLCSLVTIFPDYLYRRYGQGKRLGREINLFSMWYELRYGLTACFILTVSLITTIFYFHPSTSNVASFYRTVSILPETAGRVAEVHVQTRDKVEAGDPIFQLDDTEERAALATASRQIAEVTAEIAVAEQELLASQGMITQAEGALAQARDQLDQQVALRARNADIVSPREIERLERIVEGREGALDAARANRDAVRTRITTLLPARRESALAAQEQAQAALDKKRVVAGVSGTVQQFQLQVGDVVSPVLRPAGILVPARHEHGLFTAGFGQISAQVIKPGMVAEVACHTNPYRIVPMRVIDVQPQIADGQFRPTDQLLDAGQLLGQEPGTLTVFLEPIFAEQVNPIPPGSRCLANAYTSNHDRLDDPELSALQKAGLHAVDTVGIVHALLLRIQVFLMPVRTLTFSGGH